MKLYLSPKASYLYQALKSKSVPYAEQVKALFRDIQAHPQEGIGTPEMIDASLPGYWERRFNGSGMVTYYSEGDYVIIISIMNELLPSMKLAAHCYRGMFQNTAITSAPDLLAGKLYSNCYRYMFNACKSLEYIKCYSTTNVTNDSYTQNWLQNAKSTGTFHYRDGTTWYRDNQHGIPNGWTPVADPVQ